VLEFPERHPIGVVLDAVFGQLRRLDVKAFRERRLRGVGRAVTDGAVGGVEMHARDQRRVGRFQRVLVGRVLARHRRVERPVRGPFLERKRLGVRAGGHRAELDARIGGRDEQRDRKDDSVDESAHNLTRA